MPAYLDSWSFNIGGWYFSFFYNPKVWAFDYHRNAQCCKFWLLIGPFEINRVWLDSEEIPRLSYCPDDDGDVS